MTPANDNCVRSPSDIGFSVILLSAWLLSIAIMAARYTWWAA